MSRANTYRPRRNRLQQATTLGLTISLLLATMNLFAAATVPADKIKAAYIYQLTHFVTWPDIPSTDKTFTICVLGQEPITKELAPLDQRQSDEYLIKVRQMERVQDAADCKILYIAKNKSHRLQAILRYLNTALRDKPILTVSNIPQFAANGGIVGFVISNNKVRLEINPAHAHCANIKLNAKLLEVAHLVDDKIAGECRP